MSNIIIWIDPGTTTVWYAILKKVESNNIEIMDYWVLSSTPKIDSSIKLREIWSDIKSILDKYSPKTVVVEKLFFQTNLKTWIAVAEARWVIIYEVINSWAKLEEYTPLQVKKAITWNWKANKLQLQNAIKLLFWLLKNGENV